MIYPVEAYRDIRIQHIPLQMRGSVEDCFNGIVTGPSRSKAVTAQTSLPTLVRVQL